MGDQGLDFLVVELVGETLHYFFIAFLDAAFDGLDSCVVLELGLDIGAGVILASGLLAHLGITFAVFAVALGAIRRPVFFDIRRPGR